MSLKSDLIAAKALIDTPEMWGQDKTVGPNRRCMMLALSDVNPVWPYPAFDALAAQISPTTLPVSLIVRVNDDPDTTHEMVMSWFDRAIEAAP